MLVPIIRKEKCQKGLCHSLSNKDYSTAMELNKLKVNGVLAEDISVI